MKRYTAAAWTILLLCTSNPALAQASDRPQGVPDSIVLERKDDLCIGPCTPIADVVLRRSEVPAGALEFIVTRARAANFYDLPSDLIGKVDFCQVVMSDSRMATLTIYHADGRWSVRGYHHCLGGADWRRPSPPSEEKKKLLALEALVDSVARANVRR